MQELGLKGTYVAHGPTRRIIQTILALPYIPERSIGGAFGSIRRHVRTLPDVRLQELVEYISGVWVPDAQGRVTWAPAVWSVYGQSIRTNNDAEGYHRRLNAQARQTKLNLYRLIEVIYHDARLLPVQVMHPWEINHLLVINLTNIY